MGSSGKSNIDTNKDQSEVSAAGQSFTRVAIVTLISILAAALVLLAVLLIIT